MAVSENGIRKKSHFRNYSQQKKVKSPQLPVRRRGVIMVVISIMPTYKLHIHQMCQSERHSISAETRSKASLEQFTFSLIVAPLPSEYCDQGVVGKLKNVLTYMQYPLLDRAGPCYQPSAIALPTLS